MISLPPPQRHFSSPSGRFVLTFSSLDRRTPSVSAELVEVSGTRRRSLWSRLLPHEQGPRGALVSDSGAVVLLDEWINVVPRHAIMLIGPDGRTLALYSGEQLFAILNVPRKAISANARHGVWMSSEPIPSADGKTVEFRCARRSFTLQLADGKLTVSD
ncbi:MAG: hypothetical protein Q8Q28_15975 [Pseudomonadota bacterium]|nr:hypothetical protein [Pseudomonadota bacterium]